MPPRRSTRKKDPSGSIGNSRNRRRSKTNAHIVLHTVIGVYHLHRLDPTIVIPDELHGVWIDSRWWNGYFVHFVTGWPTAAVFILSETAINGIHSAGCKLLSYVTQLGMLHHTVSEAFGVASNQALNAILMNVTSIIAVAHPDVRQLERSVILDVPSYNGTAAGSANNKNYKNANTPVFYIDNVPFKSASAVQGKVRVSRTTVQSVCAALRERFFRQESNEPVESTDEESRALNLKDVTIICRLPPV
eukprot:scaffold686_cov245-Skeletonema_marinoi.AAC.16